MSDAVPDLVETALRNGGDHSDNVTVIALEWETPDALRVDRAAFPPTASATACSPPPSRPACSTAMVDDLDDAAIERSIAEINEAIQRSAARKAS